MKMNKIIIPAAMLAVGVALVGSISSTLAWYQYSTKAQAAFIGTSVGESESLEIKKADGNWASSLTSSDISALIEDGVGTNISPITPAIAQADGNLADDANLPLDAQQKPRFYKSVETGVSGRDSYGERYATPANYVQFVLNIRYKKNAYAQQSTIQYLPKKLNLVDLTIVDTASTSDLYKSIRVHFSAATSPSTNNLFLRDNESSSEAIDTATFGALDTDSDGAADKEWAYEWEAPQNAVYGIENSKQTAFNANYQGNAFKHQLGVLPSSMENGLAVTVTIWIEGWQKLSGIPQGNADTGSSSMWDPTIYTNKQFKVGMRFQAED